MAITKKEFSDYIKQFNFRELFNDMGWNKDKTTQSISIDETTYTLKAVAEKCGLKVLTCLVDELPNNETRRKLDTQIKRLFFYYILICIDSQGNQKWIIPIKKSEKREIAILDYASHQVPEFLYQKVSDLTFSLEQEDTLTIVDVSKLVNDLFTVNSEKVTKVFYEKFKKEHSSFLQFIKGISDLANKDWYASLMLNRLMFCYFIQKKGFLDNNKNYLRDKLKACKEKKGKVKFYSFYRDFLLVLFHKGLNEPMQNQAIKIEIGKIPYLNGGLFDEHELEKTHASIDIDDKAFERLFDFFDQYKWHLDTSITATGKDINPDVIGYIFEKYINDRANMGAYYTKEDITDYISKNCIIPYLFDETKRHYPKAFKANADLWQMVKSSGDTYIYEAIRKGVDEPLPAVIERGINDVSKRDEWNKPATINYALPTEIWREVVDRRNRYTEVKTKIDKGEIFAINDFITYNLNIRQFAQDTVEKTNDSELLKHFYKALTSVTIIDPTCGSGAFLFAAMNILEPLYESCLQRMENFVAEAAKGKYKYFEEVLAQVKSPEHPNLQYFIYKSIILRNLYGVDIMKEAVEIAKLRLFLKLVATVEADYHKPNLGLEPLPDIDFNIRAGNTLIGFATEAELQKGLTYTIDGVLAKPLIEEKCKIVANAFRQYKEIQLTYGDDFNEFKKAKAELSIRLNELNQELNHLLHVQVSGMKYETWLQTHQPFHWFAEFYEIIQYKGGFDVIIGNPPYIQLSNNFPYSLTQYSTVKCKNLYPIVMERCFTLKTENSKMGFIVPVSSISTEGYESLQKQLSYNEHYYCSFDDRPSKLFDGLEHIRLSVHLIGTKSNARYSSNYLKWRKEEREFIFFKIKYVETQIQYLEGSLPKFNSEFDKSIAKKIHAKIKVLASFYDKYGKHAISYSRKVGYFLQVLDFEPKVYDSMGKERSPSEFKEIKFRSGIQSQIALGVLNSNLFYWFITIFSDCRHLNKREVDSFFIDLDGFDDTSSNKISLLSKKLMNDLELNSELRVMKFKHDILKIQCIIPKTSKPIIDKIDSALAVHYKLTNEELDYIINYDIKYRLGKELENEE